MGAYTDAVPVRQRGQSNADKGDAGTRTNIFGFSGGMTAKYPPLVSYNN